MGLQFVGSLNSQYVTVGDIDIVDNADCTVWMDVQADSYTSDTRPFGAVGSPGANGALRILTDRLQARSGGGWRNLSAAGVVLENVRQQLCVTYHPGGFTGFVDGVEQLTFGSGFQSFNDTLQAIARSFGGAAGGYFDGKVYRFAIWDAELRNTEIAALKNGVDPLNIRRNNLIRYYDFPDSSDRIIDRSGHVDAIAIDAPTYVPDPRRKTKSVLHSYLMTLIEDSGLSAVSNTITKLFNVNAEVTNTSTHLFNILNTVSQTSTNLFNVLAQVSSTSTKLFNVRAEVSSISTHLFDIASAVSAVSNTLTKLFNINAEVSSTSSHRFGILNTISSTLTKRFGIRNIVSSTVTNLFNVRNIVSNTSTYLFDILSALSAVSNTVTSLFNVNAQVSQTSSHRFGILNTVSNAVTKIFGIRNIISQTSTHLFDIAASFTSVVNTVTGLFNINMQTLSSITKRFNINGVAPPGGQTIPIGDVPASDGVTLGNISASESINFGDAKG